MAKYNRYNGKNMYFVNPYNFVGVDFAGSPERVDIKNTKGEKTGVLRCKIIAKTPISIPDVNNQNNDKDKKNLNHPQYDFMRSLDDRPMIPGSSIRGVIRSAYEALSDSCMSTVKPNSIVTYRAKSAFLPGLIYKDSDGVWHLFSAKRYIFRVDGNSYSEYKSEPQLKTISENELKKRYSYGDIVYISPVLDDGKEKKFMTSKGFLTESIFIKRFSDTMEDGLMEGYLCIGEPFGDKKHFESVFIKNEELRVAVDDNNNPIIKKPISDLEEIVKIYNDSKINANAKKRKFYAKRDYGKLEQEKYYPIWYMATKDDDDTVINVHMSVANLGRAAYYNDMGDMLGEYKACTSRASICPACSLFGMLGKKEGLGSRIRFSDALMGQKVEKKARIPLKEMSSPKTSYLPFYLKSSNGNTGKTISYDNSNYSLRGRKFYWHSLEDNLWEELNPNKKEGERNASVELVDKDSIFSFDVYFDRITQSELDRLIWTITLGSNESSDSHCHKIGHGKPIGLGSIKIVVSELEMREKNAEGYSISQIENPKALDTAFDNAKAREEILLITDLEACTLPVSYPGVVKPNGQVYYDENKAHASFQWFSNNFSLGQSPAKMLPSIENTMNEKKALVWITPTDSKNSGNSSSSKPPKPVKYELNKEYAGHVEGYDEKTQRYARVKLDVGGYASFLDDKHKFDNKRIILEFKGVNDRGYPVWKDPKIIK